MRALNTVTSIFFYFWTFTLCGLGIIGTVLAQRWFVNWLIWFWARSSLIILGVRLQVEGDVEDSTRGRIVVFNHTSFLDIMILFSVLPQPCRFGAKAELFKVPIFGDFLRVAGFIPIERSRAEKTIERYKKAGERLANGESFILAPEGTRQSGGLGRFKMGPFVMAIEGQAPIQPIVVRGAGEIWPQGKAIVNGHHKDSKVIVQFLPLVESDDYDYSARQDMAGKVYEQMAETMEKIDRRENTVRELTDRSSYLGQIAQVLWRTYLKYSAYVFIKVRTHGDWNAISEKHPRLLVISNHSSHLDAVTLASSMPFRLWRSIYVTAAKDYFFQNRFLSYFAKYCVRGIPMDRKEAKKDSIKMCVDLLNQSQNCWLVLFPEGTRNQSGEIAKFQKGVSIFSQETDTPILFTYIEGNEKLWPKGQLLPRPGHIDLHIGMVHRPMDIEEMEQRYRTWVRELEASGTLVQGPVPKAIPAKS